MSRAQRKAPRRKTPAAKPEPSGLGAMALDNPVTAGGWLVMVLTGCLIIANATAFQSGPHPAPLFATRKAAPPPAPALTPAEERARAALRVLVRDVQIELRRLGIYEGSLDGLKGPATDRAVRAYQRGRGLRETGQIDEGLLARLAMDTGSGAPQAGLPPVPVPQPEPPAALQQTGAQGEATLSGERARVARIQTALVRLGYGPLNVDGYPGEQTANAIRRFELDRGKPITGALSPSLVTEIEKVTGRPLGG